MNKSPEELPNFFITPTCVKHLLQVSLNQIAWEDSIIAEAEKVGDAYEWPVEFDANDSIIWRLFIHDALKEARVDGLYSDDMLDKGFLWVVGAIPDYLANTPMISDDDRTALLDLHGNVATWRKNAWPFNEQ